MTRNRLLYLIALLTAGAFFFVYDGWIAMALLPILLALPLFSLLFTLLYLPWKTAASLTIPERIVCFRGETAEIRLSIPRKKGREYPLCFRIAMTLKNRMTGEVRRETVYLLAGSEQIVGMDTTHCGMTECRITGCCALDFLGLFRMKAPTPKPCRIFVYPKPVPPEPLPDFSVYRLGTLKPKPGGGFSEIHEVRAYRPGDPIKSIHWKLSAKRDDLIVREPQESPGIAASVILITPDDRYLLDGILDEAMWVALELLERGIGGHIGWNGMDSYRIADEETLKLAFDELLSTATTDFPRRNTAFDNPAVGQIVVRGKPEGGGGV